MENDQKQKQTLETIGTGTVKSAGGARGRRAARLFSRAKAVKSKALRPGDARKRFTRAVLGAVARLKAFRVRPSLKKGAVAFTGGLLFGLALACAAWGVIRPSLRPAVSQRVFEALAVRAVSFTDPTRTAADPETTLQKELFKNYPDLVGWVSVADTPLSYPVMQTPDDPDFYRAHGLDGRDSVCGVPYLAGADRPETDAALTIYGRCGENGEMFGSLLRYVESSWRHKHPSISFATAKEVRKYAVLAVFWRTEEAASASPRGRAAFESYVAAAKENALYDTGVGADWGEELLTLDAFDEDGQNFVVVAKRVR